MIDPCAMTCSECGENSATALETLDVKDGEFGPKPYRPCATCSSNDRAARAYDADAVLNVALADDLIAAGAR